MTVSPILIAVVLLIGIPLAIALVVYLIVPAGKAIGWLIAHIFKFIFREIADVLRLIGALITGFLFIPLTLANVIIARWSGAAHYGRAIEAEGRAVIACLYRLFIGNPARLLMLTPLTEGIENRLPQAVAHAPGADRPPRRTGQFDGYTIVGSLPGGGSGSKLYIARPTPEKLAALMRSGQSDIQQVVIKAFSLLDGSSLPQIVRENRALPAAKRLGLILEHELTDDRFYYVTRYVPGEPLGVVTGRLHALSNMGTAGLGDKQLTEAIDYAADLLRTLHHYHQSGLWHKDVKPDNIIISDGQAHLVDFGLVTPLRSSITLTTHGTEYFRDPEMVRLALRGVKVHEVDGGKFDLYAAGAVLYSMIENSFPAHGGLSKFAKRCPDALRWIIRRAMADYDKRYETAAAMLADLDTVARAPDPFTVRPVDLPSFNPADAHLDPAHRSVAGGPDIDEVGSASIGARGTPLVGAIPVGAFKAPGAAAAAAGVASGAPTTGAAIRMTSWWTGKYAFVGGAAGVSSAPIPGAAVADQLSRARERAAKARQRAQARLARYQKNYPAGVNRGVIAAVVALVAVVGGLSWLVASAVQSGQSVGLTIDPDETESTESTDASPATDESAAFETADASDSGTIRINGIPIGRYNTSSSPTAPDAPANPEAPSAPTRKASKSSESSSTNAKSAEAKTNSASTAGPIQPKASLFVLRDPVTFETEHRPAADTYIKSVERAGFWLHGNPTSTPPTDPADADRQTEQLASLRSALGISTFQSQPATAAITLWLETHTEYAGVLWLGRADDGSPAATITWSSPTPKPTRTALPSTNALKRPTNKKPS